MAPDFSKILTHPAGLVFDDRLHTAHSPEECPVVDAHDAQYEVTADRLHTLGHYASFEDAEHDALDALLDAQRTNLRRVSRVQIVALANGEQVQEWTRGELLRNKPMQVELLRADLQRDLDQFVGAQVTPAVMDAVRGRVELTLRERFGEDVAVEVHGHQLR